MIGRVALASTPADRFAAQIRAIQAGIDRLPDAVVRLILGDLDTARRQILGQLVNVDVGSFPFYRFTVFESQIRDAMDRFVEKYGATVAPAQSALYDAGAALAAQPLIHGGVLFHVPQISRRQLEAAQAFQASLITGVADVAVVQVSNELRRGLLIGDDVFRIAQRIAGSLDSGSTFGSVATRAESITRTELGRIQSIATQATLDETKQFVPDIQKEWRHSGNRGVHFRTGHLEANGQVRDVNAGFRVRPMTVGSRSRYEDLQYPRDPAGSPENTIFCGCLSLPYRAAWAEAMKEAA